MLTEVAFDFLQGNMQVPCRPNGLQQPSLDQAPNSRNRFTHQVRGLFDLHALSCAHLPLREKVQKNANVRFLHH